MRTLLMILSLTLAASQAFAGGSGGGGVQIDSMRTSFNEAVFHVDESEQSVRFKYGQLINNGWQVTDVEMPKTDLGFDTRALRALEASKFNHQWVELR